MRSRTHKPGTFAARELRNSFWAVVSSLAWGLSIALSSAGLANVQEPKLLLVILVLLINLGIGIAAMMVHIHWLKNVDEMIRKIWLESMAMTFGVLWIVLGSLLVLARADLIDIDHEEIGLLFVLAAAGFATGGFRTLKY